MELEGIFESGEFGHRGGVLPRTWHNEFMTKRNLLIRTHEGGQQITNVFAGTGAGKTNAVALAASDDLNLERVRRVVVCVPTKLILEQTRSVFLNSFGIHLARFDARSHKNGVTSEQQGYITTYAGVASQAAKHRRIARYEPTLAILDEVHHLGDGESWGDAAQLAFGNVPYLVTCTGSPFRPNSSGRIPFANYVPTNRADILQYKADYSYSLGRAIVDGYCREPDFRFSDDAVVKIRPAGTDREISVKFSDNVSEHIAKLRLQAAVQYGSVTRRRLLATALAECKAAGRKVIIFLGGDTTIADANSTPTMDVTTHLPAELAELGYGPDEYVSITMADKRAEHKMNEFRQSETAWILGTIGMVSEGANLPELSAAIFLTTWVADLSFIQRLGRALRFMGKGDHPDAWFYLFHHPSYHAISLSIKDEMKAEAMMKAKREREAGTNSPGTPQRTEAVAISGGEITYSIWNGEKYPAGIYREAMQYIESRGMSKAFLSDVIDQLRKEQGNVSGNDSRRSG